MAIYAAAVIHVANNRHRRRAENVKRIETLVSNQSLI